MRVRILIVDDEPLARQRVIALLQQEQEVEIAGECGNGAEALAVLRAKEIDILFLDIQMPEIDGIRMLETLGPDRTPVVIFTTAYDEFAVKAFELNAVDYLLKPFSRSRFHEALSRARRMAASQDKDLTAVRTAEAAATLRSRQLFADRLVVKSDGKIRFIPVAEIRWIESDANYVRLHASSTPTLVRDTLTNIQRSLDPSLFLRIHRTVIVNTREIKELAPWFNDELVAVLSDGTKLPVGRTYRKAVNDFFRI